MLKIDRNFLVGKFKAAYTIESPETPLNLMLEKLVSIGLIDGILSIKTVKGRTIPHLYRKGEKVSIPQLPIFFGINQPLKKAIQKFKLNKIAVVAPSCTMDGINKTQYYGIGCNWAKTAVALKIGILCAGMLTAKSLLCETLDTTGAKEVPEKLFFSDGKLKYQLTSGKTFSVEAEIHHKYVNSACRYCLNLSAKGSDITFIPIEEKNKACFIIRSERGWRTLAILQREFPSMFKFRPLDSREIDTLINPLKEIARLNIEEILERVESGLPIPKWNGNRFRKFYRAWNTLNDTDTEEVF